MKKQSYAAENYSPLYFLSSLGAGGLAISFFMYLLWMTPHEGSSIPSFFSLIKDFEAGNWITQTLIFIGCIGVAFFAFHHFVLLVWNLRNYFSWKKTENYRTLIKANTESQLMALPLTLAMTVNVLFILGAIFIPNLWETKETLFPVSLVAFSLIGFSALKTYFGFFTRVVTESGFDCAKNNNLGQMISVFAFSMIGVGFSAVAAMSHEPVVFSLGFAGAIFFTSITLLLGIIKLVLGFRAMMEHKADEQTTPTLWLIIPILTVVGITIYRLKMSLIHNFNVPISTAEISVFLVTFFSIQVFFGILGWFVMKRVKYMEKWVYGEKYSANVYALICPGVAFFVFGNFVINVALVKLELLNTMSIAYGLFYLPLIYLQFSTIRVFFKLNKKMIQKK